LSIVHRHDGAPLETQGPPHRHIVALAVGDDRETGQVAFVVQHQMQLHRSFGAFVLRPVENLCAEVNAGGIHAHQLVLETELLLAPRFVLALAQQLMEHGFIKLPGAVLVGIR
jgi:hypothetical protein